MANRLTGNWKEKYGTRATRRMAALAAFCLGLIPLAAFSATTYTVTTTNDSGAGSFRQAIQNVNSGTMPGAILFNIPGPGPFSITLQSPLPAVTNRVTIDAATQPGYPGSPLVELNGASLGSGSDGLYITAGNSTVRGLAIHGFSGAGIRLALAGGNIIQGNYIGTDLTGTSALPNGMGIQIENDSPNNFIGGTNSGNGNLISGNSSQGIVLNQSSGNLIEGNFIGTDASGIASLGNNLDGIYLNNASSNIIGGVLLGTANTIIYNGGAGVRIPAGTANAVRGNSIYANGGLGIDLGVAGVQTNTPGGPHAGANNLQNYPVLAPIVASGNTLFIHGSLNSTPNTSFQIDFYNSPICDPSGHGQGKIYLGSASIATDANGNAGIDFSTAGSIPIGSYISATATDTAGNTSEFSACQRFVPASPVDLGLTVSAAPYAQVGDQLSYSITVTNSGTNAA
ncbi:MAG TPA: right-handed parallel beta-helix repeat-containing protein, partial [Verrucomicrobiae bacterium]|nr:right-handed parallel beta-helix repeat-containing protein [Verrucomicrobiae bacterium]